MSNNRLLIIVLVLVALAVGGFLLVVAMGNQDAAPEASVTTVRPRVVPTASPKSTVTNTEIDRDLNSLDLDADTRDETVAGYNKQVTDDFKSLGTTVTP